MNPRLAAWRSLCNALFSDVNNYTQPPSELWPRVIRLADVHRVTPALWLAFRRKSLLDSISADVHRYCRAFYEMNAERNAGLLKQLNEVIGVLNARGIVPILMKGAGYLKANVYQDPAARIFSDLDLLLDESDIPVAVEALHSTGYQPARLSTTDYAKHRHCEPMFRSGEYGKIELHRSLFSTDLADVLPIDHVKRAAIERVEPGVRYRYLSPAHMVVVSFLHSQIIDRYGETFTIGLRPILDLTALRDAYRENLGFTRIDGLLRKNALQGRFRNYLFAAERVSAISPFGQVPAGPSQWANYAVAHARIRWQCVERLNLHELTFDSIRRRKGHDLSAAALCLHQLTWIRRVIGRKLRLLPE